MKLRPYQIEAIAETGHAWDTGIFRPALVLATGLGKTVILAEVAKQATKWTGPSRTAFALLPNVWTGEFEGTPMVLVHRDELAGQTVAKLLEADPDLRIGVVKAERNEWQNVDVIVASVQTLARKRRREQIPADAVNLVIVDECHHAAADSYVNVMEYFGCLAISGKGRTAPVEYPTRALGVTATMGRQDSRGLGQVWNKVVFERDITFGIFHTGNEVERYTEDGDGYLCDVRGILVEVGGLDLTQVARTAGDYQAGSLGEALTAFGAGEAIVKGYLEHAPGKRAILFAPTVPTARLFAADFIAAGITCEVITGETEPDERRAIYARFESGETLVLASCMVLTEGFDAPWAEVAIIARPTSSPMLYIQMAGRVLRPSPATGKTGALLLDVVGAVKRHKLVLAPDLSDAKVRPGESIVEAREREKKEESAKLLMVGGLTGQAEYVETDLFHTGEGAWLQTEKGVKFLRTSVHYFFVWHEKVTNTYKVGTCKTFTSKGGRWLISGLTEKQAMEQCENYAIEEDPSIAKRNSPWRKKKGKNFSTSFKAMAGNRGIEYDDNSNAGDVSDAIAVKNASKILDVNIRG